MRWFACLSVIVLLAGCSAPPGGDQRDQWQSEVPARVGVVGAFDVTADAWAMVADGTLKTGDVDIEQVAFLNATLADGRTGDLIVEGGTLKGFTTWPVAHIQSNEALAFRPDGDLGARGEHAGRVGLAIMVGQANDVSVVGHSKATLHTADGEEDVGAVAVKQAENVGVVGKVEGSGPWTLDATRFALAGELEGRIRERANHDHADGIWGLDTTIHLRPGSIIASSARISQVVVNGEPVIPAEIEVGVPKSTGTVKQGDEQWFLLNYREKSYSGDAVIDEIVITEGAQVVEVPTAPTGATMELFALIEEEPWLAMPVVFGLSFVVIGDILSCVFEDCPQWQPYPAWMSTGDVGKFYVKLEGDRNPGTYPVTVEFRGKNFATETVTFDVVIE